MPSDVSALAARLGLGVVAVVGAGLSMGARYPNTLGLNALLWDAVDVDPDARRRLADRLGVDDAPGKALIGDDEASWERAWTAIQESATCRSRFQAEFVNVDATRSVQPSLSHEALARLIHAGIVECVVSLNWDSALERAYRRLYGTPLSSHVLYKPHGDVAFPEEPWVLPHENGHVDEGVLARIRGMVAEHPRTLLIVGYSESDQAVVNELIAPLDERWRVVRVGPSVTGDEDVTGRADDVLGALAAPFVQRENESAWHVVASWGTRDIDAAMEGRRLQPADVVACPRLSETDLLARALRRDHAVVLNGPSGSGKSITAYQVLHQLCEEGWEVLRLRDRSRAAGRDAWLADLPVYHRRKVLFVDDAQDLSPDTVRELAEAATEDRLVLVVGVDHVAGGVTTLTMSEAAAVGALEHHVRQRRDEMFERVRELDDRIGDGIGDERFEDRLAAAAREKAPWQFFFTLTGGWRRTVDRVNQVRARERADLAALALAVAQIASVDAGVTVLALQPYAAALGRDEAWLRRALDILQEERLAIEDEDEDVWRCAHLRAARVLVRWALHPPVPSMPDPAPPLVIRPIASATEDGTMPDRDEQRRSVSRRRTPSRLPDVVVEEHRETVTRLINTALDQPSTSMRGVAWLIADYDHEVQWVMRRRGIRSERRDRSLALQALETGPGPDVAMAAQLLVQLSWPENEHVLAEIWSRIGRVIDWVHTITPESGWAVADLVNVLGNADRDRLMAHLAGVEPERVADLIRAGGWPHIYSTMRAVDRISQCGGPALMRAIGAALHEDLLADMLRRAPSLWAINELLGPLAYLAPDLGLRLFNGVAVSAADILSRDLLGTHHEVFDTVAFLLGFAPSFLRKEEPSPEQREAARRFADAIDKDALAAAMSRPNGERRWHNFPQFLSFLEEANPEGFAAVLTRLDFGVLNQEFEAQLPRPGANLLFVLMLAADTRSAEVRSLLEAHADRLAELDSLLAWTHPELAVSLLRRGLPLDLGLASHNYAAAAEVLERVAAADEAVAAEVADANAVGLAAGLVSSRHPPFDGIARWIEVCDRISPNQLDGVLGSLSPTLISTWKQHLKNEHVQDHLLALANCVSKVDGTPAAAAALDLLQMSGKEAGGH